MTDNINASVVKFATQEEVELFSNAASITDNIVPVQILTFSENLNFSDLKLIELPQTVVSALELGESIVFRGRPNDSLVLCTSSESYEIQQADTSNLLLLSPNIMADIDQLTYSGREELLHAKVISSFHETFEMKEFRPKYERTHALLNKHPFECIEQESTLEDCYTFSELLKESQASEGELLIYLKKIQALEIDTHWRVLEYSFRDSIIFQILNLIEENEWDWRGFPWKICLEMLSPLFPKFILEHVLCIYGRHIDDQRMSLDEELVCMFHAECLLKPVRKFAYSEFLEIWQQSVPLGMQTNSTQLLAISIADMSSSPPSIWYFPEERLNSQPYERLAQLFREKDKWTEDEIRPFLITLETAKTSVSSILLHCTRSSLDVNRKKCYSLKKTH
ncbi:Sister chromatid cohesion protein DCC1 [Oopsacas minuta]|uniref:Sister chromatid cohesion protein DCC1 n=1 Tax=Oopsacas minuta TaxID=111878 RepID=A0AAV7JS86_9METZ|nr:Sister chromatid cohesion protein DCC1 [Oopsacas minuta]